VKSHSSRPAERAIVAPQDRDSLSFCGVSRAAALYGASETTLALCFSWSVSTRISDLRRCRWDGTLTTREIVPCKRGGTRRTRNRFGRRRSRRRIDNWNDARASRTASLKPTKLDRKALQLQRQCLDRAPERERRPGAVLKCLLVGAQGAALDSALLSYCARPAIPRER